jgi:S-adenosylmethionine:tRNA ribosyltransferase-isomerase
MKPATTSMRRLENTRVLSITSNPSLIRHASARELTELLRPGDLLVVNRSATIPSSFHGTHKPSKKSIEIRLASFRGASPGDLSSWHAIAFGSGDWRTPTENRASPPELKVADMISIGQGLDIKVEAVDKNFNRLIQIEFIGRDLISSLYKYGSPIQYSYMNETLAVWDQQTLFAGPALSVEPPSAAFAMSWELLFKLQNAGVEVATVLHGAGISTSGSRDLDRHLPLEEWFEVGTATVDSIFRTKTRGGKVVALGTSVARALESSVNFYGRLEPKSGFTSLRIGTKTKIKVVDALISGLHEPGTSHLELSKAFCSKELVEQAYDQASSLPYRNHEFGDLSFLSCF